MGKCFSTNKERRKETLSISAGQLVIMKKKNFSLDYDIEATLKTSSHSSVFKIKDKLSNDFYLLRTISLKGGFEQYRNEMNLLKSLDHPNIVKILDIFLDSNSMHIISEFCSGKDLFGRISSQTQLTESEAAKYTLQLSSALSYIHNRSIVHREIYPENLLFSNDEPDALLKIVDFNSAIYSETAAIGKRPGNPFYTAPEAFAGTFSEKSDVWSLGTILYIMLSGTCPFEGISCSDVAEKVVREEISYSENVWSKVSCSAKDLLSKMLEKNPEKRISAKEMLEHEWIVSYKLGEISKSPISQRLIKRLSVYNITSSLHKAILSFIASQMTDSEDIAELRATFEKLDRNHDGILTYEEIKTAFEQGGILLEDEKKFLETIDLDHSQSISYTEFLTCLINWKAKLSSANLKKAFNMIDINRDGKISLDELVEVLGGKGVSKNYFVQMMKMADSNGDGYIDLKEFCEFINQ